MSLKIMPDRPETNTPYEILSQYERGNNETASNEFSYSETSRSSSSSSLDSLDLVLVEVGARKLKTHKKRRKRKMHPNTMQFGNDSYEVSYSS